MFLEIDVDEVTRLLLGEDRPDREKPTVKRKWTGPIDRGFKNWPVGWPQGADFDTLPIPQHFER